MIHLPLRLDPLVPTFSDRWDQHPRKAPLHNPPGIPWSEHSLTASLNEELTPIEHCVGSNVLEAGQNLQLLRPDVSSNVVATQEIETWVEAIGFYDNNDFDSALRTFDNIPDTAKILFNCGVIHATLGEHKKAVGITRGSRN